MKRLAKVGAVVGMAVALPACAADIDGMTAQAEASSSAAAAALQPPRLTAALDECRLADGGRTLELADGGATLIIDTGSEYGSVDGLVCVLGELRTPQSIIAGVERTNSLMGLQEASDDGLDYSWTYHPDNGVNMVITDSEFESDR